MKIILKVLFQNCKHEMIANCKLLKISFEIWEF